MYQDLTTTDAVQPTAVYPAQLARHIPAPQPVFVPAASPAIPGVVMNPDGSVHYGHPPIIYAQAQSSVDPQAMAKAVERIGQGVQMIGAGGLVAGAGFGVNEAVGAMAGISTTTVLAVAALAVAARLRAPRRVINHIREEYHYDQSITNVAKGWFSHADGSVGNDNSKTFNNT